MTHFAEVNILDQRSSGILLPLFSLPSSYGIGDIGPSSWKFIDFLAAAGQSCWQILPLSPINQVVDNSPYMSSSALAWNPLFLSPDLLLDQGLLSSKDLPASKHNEYLVDYAAVAREKARLLRRAWNRFGSLGNYGQLQHFCEQHHWIQDHALFTALKSRFQQQPWYEWPEPLRQRHAKAIQEAEKELHGEIQYAVFEQYLFFHQWQLLRQHAQNRGIHIIGDLPIYVALDSADVWAHQEIFSLDAQGRPVEVAGVPPDYFSRLGQLWGNPLYRWHESPQLTARLFDWWESRFRATFAMVDLVRIDHFRGFESYWVVPAHEKTAVNGSWRPGPGKPFFLEMLRRMGPLPIIAEDLGVITPAVEQLRDELGFPGMKVLLFAFDGATDNAYLPHNCPRRSVIFTGTHDNDTAVGWYLNPDISPEAKLGAKHYANQQDLSAAVFHRDMLHLALSAPSNLALLPMQDVLGFGNDCRINIPGTSQGNWRWRCAPRFITDELSAWLKEETAFFGRIPTVRAVPEHCDDGQNTSETTGTAGSS